MSHAANTSIQDTQNGIGDFTLLPEADRNSLDDYMKLPEQNRLNTCSHGYLIEQGVKSNMNNHDDGSGDWTLCKDDQTTSSSRDRQSDTCSLITVILNRKNEIMSIKSAQAKQQLETAMAHSPTRTRMRDFPPTT